MIMNYHSLQLGSFVSQSTAIQSPKKWYDYIMPQASALTPQPPWRYTVGLTKLQTGPYIFLIAGFLNSQFVDKKKNKDPGEKQDQLAVVMHYINLQLSLYLFLANLPKYY